MKEALIKIGGVPLKRIQVEALHYANMGYTFAEIAVQLNISESYVEKMLGNDSKTSIYQKIGVTSKRGAVCWYQKNEGEKVYAALIESSEPSSVHEAGKQPSIDTKVSTPVLIHPQLDLSAIDHRIRESRNAGRRGQRNLVHTELPSAIAELDHWRDYYSKSSADVKRFGWLTASASVGLLISYIGANPHSNVEAWSSKPLADLHKYRHYLREDDREDFEISQLLPIFIDHQDKNQIEKVKRSYQTLLQVRDRVTTEYAKMYCHTAPPLLIPTLVKAQQMGKKQALEQLQEEELDIENFGKEILSAASLTGIYQFFSLAYLLLDELDLAQHWLSKSKTEYENSIEDGSVRIGGQMALLRTELLVHIHDPKTKYEDISTTAFNQVTMLEATGYPHLADQVIDAIETYGDYQHKKLAGFMRAWVSNKRSYPAF